MRYSSKLAKRLSRNDAGRMGLIWLALLWLGACTDGGGPISADVVALRLMPQEPEMALGDSLEFSVVGLTVAGDTVVVDVSWSTGDGEIKGKGQGKAQYKPRRSGKDTVTASADLLADTTTVTVVPAAPVITAPSEGATLTTATPTIAGTAASNISVEVFADTGPVATVTATGGGSWSYTLTAAQALADGAHTTAAVAMDADGNRSATSATVNFAVALTDTVEFVTGLVPKEYAVARLGVGDQYYVDRAFTVTALGPGLADRLWIKAANDDRGSTTDSAISFTLLEETVVVVGYDSRATALPTWLQSWEQAAVSIGVSDGSSPLTLLHKALPVGSVVLGGNLAAGAQGAQSMYTVMLLQPSELLPVALQIAPTSVTLDPGASTQFSATVTDPLGRPTGGGGAIEWAATGGTITAEGLYTAGEVPGRYHVIAHDTERGIADTAEVSITDAATGLQVGTWGRAVVALDNPTYTGNPFELEVDATFTHSGGTTITLPGYYGGNATWKVGFMPTLAGTWTYVTSSSDADLNGRTGTVTAASSGNLGLLAADASYPRKWKFADGPYVAVPTGLLIEIFFEPATEAQFNAAADFMAANNIHMVDAHLQDESSPTMMAFSGPYQNHEFNLSYWDLFEERLDALAARGLGAYIMPYVDAPGLPDWPAQSATEILLLRYLVARTAGYPIIWYDTGVDIGEYRDQADIDWFGAQIRALDPYNHPISSRYNPTSGPYLMAGRTYDSYGQPNTARIDDLVGRFEAASIPVAMTDVWGENRPSNPSKDFRPEDIRRGMWKLVVAGGLGTFLRGGDGYFHIADVQSDLESEQWIRLVNPFVERRLGDTFGAMVPSPSLVGNGYCLADPARTRLLYVLIGANDRWDDEPGGNVTVKLSGVSGTFNGIWFDPRDGSETPAGSLAGGSDHILTPPNNDDWVLLLTRTQP